MRKPPCIRAGVCKFRPGDWALQRSMTLQKIAGYFDASLQRVRYHCDMIGRGLSVEPIYAILVPLIILSRTSVSLSLAPGLPVYSVLWFEWQASLSSSHAQGSRPPLRATSPLRVLDGRSHVVNRGR